MGKVTTDEKERLLKGYLLYDYKKSFQYFGYCSRIL